MPALLNISFCLFFWAIYPFDGIPPADFYRCDNGKVAFSSEAPLETIKAESAQLRGIIDVAQNGFAWTIPMSSFQGFNSALQREHFNENYLESERFPNATFNGKIIEKIDFQQDGNYVLRAKGKLNFHGVEQERIIKSNVQIKGGKMLVHAEFSILLSDHNISIPKIVQQKIAEEINVRVDATLLAASK